MDISETVDIYQKQSFVSAKPGEAVTLQCTLADHQSSEIHVCSLCFFLFIEVVVLVVFKLCKDCSKTYFIV